MKPDAMNPPSMKPDAAASNAVNQFSMPAWLLKDEGYVPAADKDTFINKSIIAFMDLVATLKAQDQRPKDLFKVNAFFRVLFTVLLILLVSLAQTFTFVYIVIAYLLVLLCVMPVKDIINTFKISMIMTLLTVVMLIPTIFYGNYFSVVMIPVKVFVTITAVNILSRSTGWDQIIAALKRFRLPDLIIFVLDITLKYIVMLGELVLEMLYALKLRSVGKNRSKHTALSGIAGTIFIKSREMAEEMYQAMECRGFTGAYHIYYQFKFGLADLIYVLINIWFIAMFIYLYY